MARYSWEGRTAAGQLIQGEMEAPSRETVAQNLKTQRLTITRVEEKAGAQKTGGVEPAPPSAGGRPRESFRDRYFHVGVVAFFAAFSVFAAWIDPVLFYDCARQANGSVDCTVHRRMYGVIPLGDLHFTRILSVEVKSGVHSETMADRARRLRLGGDESSYETLLLVCADGTRWQSPQSVSPLGRTLSDHRQGIQELIDASSPATYHGWTAEKVTLTIMVAFLAPVWLILLGLVLRIVMPRAFTEKWLPAMQAWARRRQASRQASR